MTTFNSASFEATTTRPSSNQRRPSFQTRSLRSFVFGMEDHSSSINNNDGGDDDDNVGNPLETENSQRQADMEELLHFWEELCANEREQEQQQEEDLPQGRPSLESNASSGGHSILSQHWAESTRELGLTCCSSSPRGQVSTTNSSKIVPCKSIDQDRDLAISLLFDRLDQDGDGLLDRQDLQRLLTDAAAAIHLNLSSIVIDAAIDALIEDAESDEALQSLEVSTMIGDYNTGFGHSSLACCDALDSINKAQFSDIFKRHPDMLRAFLRNHTNNNNNNGNSSIPLSESERLLQEEENEQIWQTRRWNKNWNVTAVWLVLYLLANVACFVSKAIKYSHHEEAQAVFGPAILAARGAAQCLNLNCALILLPMARHFMTRLRATRARFYFPFDSIVDCHKLIGCAILFWTVVHVGAHMSDFYMFSKADQDDIYALVGHDNKLGTVPESAWGRWKLLLSTTAGITGIVMVLCMLVAYPMLRVRRRNFNAFWTTHHLLIVMLVALCFHGTGNLLEHYQSIFWLIIPLGLYLVPRFLRETYCSRTIVLDAKIKKGGVLCLRLQKPGHWDGLQAGMYAFVQVPAVNRLEWHPFTLTSSSSDPYLEFHISNAGDWTHKLHKHVETLDTRGKANQDLTKSDPNAPDVTETSLAGDTTSLQTIKEYSSIPASSSVADSLHSRGAMTINDSIHSNSTRFAAAADPPPEGIRNMVVKIEGPIGASSQGFSDHPILVLVGAGIGVTPMISVLKELLQNPGKVQRCFMYWTTRDKAAFEWFSDIMDKVYRHDKAHVLQVRHFLTSVKDDHRDIGAVLLHHATRAKHRANGFDLILGQQTHHQVEVGRPNWEDELKSIKQEAKHLGFNECGIFLCGGKRMAEHLADVSAKASRNDPKFHFHFTKESF